MHDEAYKLYQIEAFYLLGNIKFRKDLQTGVLFGKPIIAKQLCMAYIRHNMNAVNAEQSEMITPIKQNAQFSCSYGVGFILWNIDNAFCSHVR